MLTISCKNNDKICDYSHGVIASVQENRDKLADIILLLKNDIETRNLKGNDRDYQKIDLYMMCLLVEQANKKYPDLNLKFLSDKCKIESEIATMLEKSIQSARFIVNTSGTSRTHFSTFDCRLVRDKLSLVILESASFTDQALETIIEINKILRKVEYKGIVKYSVCDLNIQKGRGECGIYSISFAKKLYKERTALDALHEINVNTPWDFGNSFSDVVGDKYLSASFYKHSQSQKRIEEYLEARPDMVGQVVNKKGENLLERYKNNLIEVDNKPFSLSCWNKRLAEYQGIINAQNG